MGKRRVNDYTRRKRMKNNDYSDPSNAPIPFGCSMRTLVFVVLPTVAVILLGSILPAVW